MTAPSRDVVRHYHEHDGWWLVADTDNIDVWTFRTERDRYLMRVLDCDGTRFAHRYINVQGRDVTHIVAAHIRRELSS